MLSCLIIVLAAAQAPAGNNTGSAKTPYVITLKNGTEFVGFWEERRVSEINGQITVETDTPWKPEIKRGIRADDVKDAIRELPQAREKRKAQALKAAGLVEVDGLFISESEFGLAKRAREMAGVPTNEAAAASRESSASAPPETAEPAAATEVQQPPRPGFLTQWGGHAGILLLAGILIGLVTTKLLLKA